MENEVGYFGHVYYIYTSICHDSVIVKVMVMSWDENTHKYVQASRAGQSFVLPMAPQGSSTLPAAPQDLGAAEMR